MHRTLAAITAWTLAVSPWSAIAASGMGSPLAPVLPADDVDADRIRAPHRATAAEIESSWREVPPDERADGFGDAYPTALGPGDPGYDDAVRLANEALEQGAFLDAGDPARAEEDESRDSLERFALSLQELDPSDAADFAATAGVSPSVAEGGMGIAVGSPGGGRLLHGLQFPLDHPDFEVVSPRNAYGTADTIDGIVRAVQQVRTRFPDLPRTMIGDLSASRGGRLRPHRSHQNGLDVDMGFYYLAGEEAGRRFEPGRASNLDVEKTFALIEALIDTGTVQYIFLDYRVQGLLYAYARDTLSYPQEILDAWFEYPERKWVRGAIVKHVRGHDDHLHVRFVCPEGQESCRD